MSSEQDDIDYKEGVDAYHQGWDDRENGRPNLSAEDSTGHYAGGWEAHEEQMAPLVAEAEAGYDPATIRQVDTAELRYRQAHQDETRAGAVREVAGDV